MHSARSLTWFGALSIIILAMVVLGFTGGRVHADAADSDKSGAATGSVTKGEKPGGLTAEQKKSYARFLARWVMPILLLLVIFVVLVMVSSRAFRMWILGRQKPVKFGPVNDVWSQAKDVQNRKGKKRRK